jgi:hypothetical protein
MTTDPNENADYLERREAQERALAETAIDPAARHAHLDLAQHYADRRAALTAPVSDAA